MTKELLMRIQELATKRKDLEQQLAEQNKTIERLYTLCDKWNMECDEMREDNERLALKLERIDKELRK